MKINTHTQKQIKKTKQNRTNTTNHLSCSDFNSNYYSI